MTMCSTMAWALFYLVASGITWGVVSTQDEDDEEATPPFKIVVIGEDRLEIDMDKIVQYLNATREYMKIKDFDLIIPRKDNENQAFAEICASLDAGASFLISLAQSKKVQYAVRKVSEQSAIPAIQIDFQPWTYPLAIQYGMQPSNDTIEPFNPSEPAASVNSSNYITMVPPTTVALSMLGELLEGLNMTEVTILYDDQFDLNTTFIEIMLSKTDAKIKKQMMAINETLIRDQINELKRKRVKNLVLFCQAVHAEAFALKAKAEFDSDTFNWLLYTTDTAPFQCDECDTVKIHWVSPNDNGCLHIDEFKDWLRRERDITDLVFEYNQLDVAFYLDLTVLAKDLLLQANSTLGFYPDYACSNRSALLMEGNETAPSLTEFILKEEFTGRYGPYEPYNTNRFYQNVEMKIIKLDNEADASHGMKVGNWTAVEGLNKYYEGTLDPNVRSINHYRVVIIEQPPFVEKYWNETLEDYAYRGYCIELMQLIAESLKFDYTIHPVKDGMYGTMNEKGEWNGLIKELIQQEADIALAPLSVMAERENVVDFTVPYYDLVGTTILMKKAEQTYDLFKFMSVLEPQVWGCIVGAYFFTSFLLWIFDRFSPYSYTNNREKYKDDPEKREFTFKECLWFCMTSLTPQGGGEAPKNISGRLVAATWWLFGFIIIASYTANLAAFLTVSRLETPITSLDDLAKQYKIRYAPVKGSASETYFKRMAEIEDRFYDIWKAMSLNESMTASERAQLAVWDYPVSDKFTNMWRYMQEAGLPNSTQDAIDRVYKSPSPTDGFAFIGDATEIRYAQLTNCSFQQVGNEFSRKPYAIAVKQRSPLKDKISGAILKLLNLRELERLKEDWWTQNPNKKDCPKPEDESDGISIENIGGVFIVILVGIVLSIITLAFEYWYYKDRRPPGSEDDPSPALDGSGMDPGKQTQLKELNMSVGTNGNIISDMNKSNGVNGNHMDMGHHNSAYEVNE